MTAKQLIARLIVVVSFLTFVVVMGLVAFPKDPFWWAMLKFAALLMCIGGISVGIIHVTMWVHRNW
jgi:fatty-acid desaturase